MFIPVDLKIVLIAISATFAVGILCAIFRIAWAQKKHGLTITQAISVLEQVQKLQPQLISSASHLESDGQALRKIATQIEAAVSDLSENLSTSLAAAAEKHVCVIESLRDHIDFQEEQLANVLTAISESLRVLPAQQQKSGEAQREGFAPSRLRRETLSKDPALRFSVLTEWVTVNTLAIRHRVSQGWSSANDLIANIPRNLEAEAEVLNDCILVIGTRRHPEKLAILLREPDSSDLGQWFDSLLKQQSSSNVHAVLVPANGQYKIPSKDATATK